MCSNFWREHVARCKKSHCRRHLSPTKSSAFPRLRCGIGLGGPEQKLSNAVILSSILRAILPHTPHSPATEKWILINLRYFFNLLRFISHFSSPHIITPSSIHPRLPPPPPTRASVPSFAFSPAYLLPTSNHPLLLQFPQSHARRLKRTAAVGILYTLRFESHPAGPTGRNTFAYTLNFLSQHSYLYLSLLLFGVSGSLLQALFGIPANCYNRASRLNNTFLASGNNQPAPSCSPLENCNDGDRDVIRGWV